ncbi:hypothetical protein [Burkholderia glumae]|uniref:hypothetical protein n=1 Tax=Burkholderia glumae TaxID=337 RepID=UPI0018E259B5|nr:hypothetical protein [Burkholderia glumae]
MRHTLRHAIEAILTVAGATTLGSRPAFSDTAESLGSGPAGAARIDFPARHRFSGRARMDSILDTNDLPAIRQSGNPAIRQSGNHFAMQSGLVKPGRECAGGRGQRNASSNKSAI